MHLIHTSQVHERHSLTAPKTTFLLGIFKHEKQRIIILNPVFSSAAAMYCIAGCIKQL
jgi:hypothetical protein